MKFDFCLLFNVLGSVLHNVVTTQLVEDKLCLNNFKMDRSFCSNITAHLDSDEIRMILLEADDFKNYQFLVMNAPALLLSIFVGYWLDNYPRYFKLMLILPIMGELCRLTGLLINAFIFKAR